MKRAVVLLAVLLLAGCGGRPKPDHATLTDVHVDTSSVRFTFDSAPDEIKAAYVSPTSIAECGSGLPRRPNGGAALVIHFMPAQSTAAVPYRIELPSGPVLDLWKVCDFEADVAWAIGLDGRRHYDVSSHGGTVTVSFDGAERKLGR